MGPKKYCHWGDLPGPQDLPFQWEVQLFYEDLEMVGMSWPSLETGITLEVARLHPARLRLQARVVATTL